MKQIQAYLAGPDVFLPDAAAHAAAKIAICARRGIVGVSPFNPSLDLSQPSSVLWRQIFAHDLRMMRECDLIIANLTPFRGASADAGTLVELGWFMCSGKPVFGYSNDAADFQARSQAQRAALPDPIPGLGVEDFGLSDNLMIPGAVEHGGGALVLPPDGVSRAFDSLEIFELCVASAARRVNAKIAGFTG
jgi:nucleoside 2-deoxyribosyltransferase